MITTIIITILAILLAIVVIVAVHEFGHLLVARLLNIKVIRFSIGFGKPLLSFKPSSGIEYVISAIPLGGYVRMLDEREGEVPPELTKQAFNRQTVGKRFLVLFAGPLTNILFAFLLFFAIAIIGYSTVKPVIDEVKANTPIAFAGIRAPQTIVAIDGWETPDWRTASLAIISRIGDQGFMFMTLKSDKQGKPSTYILNLKNWRLNNLKPKPIESLGIVPMNPKQHPEIRHFQQVGGVKALHHAWQETYRFVKFNLIVLGKIIIGKISLQSIAGPISLMATAGKAFSYGLVSFLFFIAILSLAIGIINLVPIPGLDGGHIFLLLVEKIRGKPMSVAAQVLAYRLGMIFLCVIVAQVLITDVLRLMS